jgi:transposase
LDLYFTLQEQNVCASDLETFGAELLEHFPRGIILVLDRWSVHLSAAAQLRRRFPRRVRIEWLPSYAPELNPDEQVWTQTKYRDLANFCPDNLTELTHAVRHSLEHTKSHPSLLRSFFKHVGLAL